MREVCYVKFLKEKFFVSHTFAPGDVTTCDVRQRETLEKAGDAIRVPGPDVVEAKEDEEPDPELPPVAPLEFADLPKHPEKALKRRK